MILVTGGSGFLGSYLIKSLVQKKFPVRAIRQSTSDISVLGDYNAKIEWVECDVRDPLGMDDAMHGIEKVYHCASMVSFNPGRRDEMYSVNVEGTANVMNCALEAGVKKVVHVSSTSSFGRIKGGATITEETKWTESKLNSHYSKSKFQGEREVWRAIAEGLNAVIVNPSVILGAWNWNKGPARFFSQVWNGQRFYTEGINGFVDVRDVVEIMIGLMESEIYSERFILSSESISYRELLNKISGSLNKKAPQRKAGNFLLSTAVLAERINSRMANREPLINSETARFGQEQFVYNNAKIVAALNYRFRTLNETIEQIGQKFLESKQKKLAGATFY